MVNSIIEFFSEESISDRLVNSLIVSIFSITSSADLSSNKFLTSFLLDEENEMFKKMLSSIGDVESNSLSLEDLVVIFEFVLSPDHKVVDGAIYTPPFIREYIVNQTIGKYKGKIKHVTVCDPSCGCAAFLLTAAVKLKNKYKGITYKNIIENCLYGVDIEFFSVERSKIILNILSLNDELEYDDVKVNVFQGNSLDFNFSTIGVSGGFSFTIGNPPYVAYREIRSSVKESLSIFQTTSTGLVDLSIPFVELAYKITAKKGTVSYITMNTWIKSLSGRGLRHYLLSRPSKMKILDFGNDQVFKGKSTYTCILTIEKVKSSSIKYARGKVSSVYDEIEYSKIPTQNLNCHSGWNLYNNENNNLLESYGNSIASLYETRNGLATLKNAVFVIKKFIEREGYIDFTSRLNNENYTIEKGLLKGVLNPNNIYRDEFNNLIHKIIFPYNIDKGKPNIVSEKYLKEKYPLTFKYLLAHKSYLMERSCKNDVLWYEFGRTQSLILPRFKMFFPHISNKKLSPVLVDNDDLYFYNGIAAVSNEIDPLIILREVMSTKIFWNYIKDTSKPYESGYYSLSKTYISKFNIPNFSKQQVTSIIKNYNAGMSNEKLISRIIKNAPNTNWSSLAKRSEV